MRDPFGSYSPRELWITRITLGLITAIGLVVSFLILSQMIDRQTSNPPSLSCRACRRAGIEPVRIVAGFRVGDSAIEFGVDSAGVFVAGVVGRGWVEMSRKELETIESEIHGAQIKAAQLRDVKESTQ